MGVLHGIPMAEVLECEDPVRRLVIDAVLDHAARIDGERRQDLANRIAQAIGGG